MKRVLSLVATLAVALGLTTTIGAPADAAPGRERATAFSRETVRLGDNDTDAYHIEHVYEVQYRLRWLGLLKARPNGHFGPLTEAAVIRFQKKHELTPSGVVGPKTWRLLIPRTIRGRRAVPDACTRGGWHACYDRTRHQVNLYHDGTLLNSWLVRGGDYSTPTRVGSFTVYRRDIDHYSAQFDGAPMPYSQFFSGGEALHGSRFMVDPFEGHSHGCVNMWVKDARQLWNLASKVKLRVHVYGAWD
jgi:hypothetical protein